MKELERLADIFEKAAERDAASPRVATQSTEVPRVPKKESAQTDSPPPLHRVSDKEDGENEDAPTGMVDTEEPAPRFNLRSAARGNIMTDVMLSVIEMSGKNLTPKQLSGRQFPMQFLCEISGAVMDEETGDMLEYCHLVKMPKYQAVWSKAFGKEIGRLAQGQKGVVEGTNALFFIPQLEVPPERQKCITYVSVLITDQRKLTRTEFGSQWVGTLLIIQEMWGPAQRTY
jgi:hypothetical protein